MVPTAFDRELPPPHRAGRYTVMTALKQHRYSGITVALVLLLITAVILWLQIDLSRAPTYGYDEMWHIYLASVTPTWKFLLAVSGDAHPPGHYLLMRPIFALGYDAVYPRLFSAVPSALTLPLLYVLLRRLRISIIASLTTVLVLASAISFLHLGVTVRAYALSAFILLAAVWYWSSLLPGTNARPSRWASIASLALFTLAFLMQYAAAFVTAAVFAATLLVMLLNGAARQQIWSNLRSDSGWPEWVLFFVSHLLIAFWFFIGWIRHISLKTPDYLAAFNPQPDQTLLEFLHIGLRRELELFTPLEGFSAPLLDVGLLAMLLLTGWLVFDNLRRGSAARAVIALSPLLITAILAIVGALGKYPFGGGMRHQYILFPFLLMLLPLALESIQVRLPQLLVGIAMGLLVLSIATANAIYQHKHRLVGEAPPHSQFAPEFKQLFASAPDTPLLVPNFAFFPAWVNRMPHGIHYHTSYQGGRDGMYIAYQGTIAPLLSWPAYENYHYTADDGSKGILISDHYRWDLPPVPDETFFIQLAQLLHRMDKTAITVFAFQTEHPYQPDEAGLRAAAAANGFTLTGFKTLGDGAVWRVERTPAALAAPLPTMPQDAALGPGNY